MKEKLSLMRKAYNFNPDFALGSFCKRKVIIVQ